jgi:hypothetical protein
MSARDTSTPLASLPLSPFGRPFHPSTFGASASLVELLTNALVVVCVLCGYGYVLGVRV